MVPLYCAICRKYEDNLRSLKNFRRDWIVGSTNQRTSNLVDHATSEVHKASMSKLRVERSRARGESVATSTTLLKIIKTKCWTSINNSTLYNLLEINVEGPPLTSFNANAAIQLWWTDCCTSRRVNQNPRKEYRPRATSSGSPLEESTSVDDTESSTLTLSAWDDWFDTDSSSDED